MNKPKIISFLLIAGLLIYLLIPKTIAVIYQNSIETKVLNVELFLDNKKIENKEVVYSFMLTTQTSWLDVGLGYHTIKIKCDELKVEKNVKVFTLFRNYVDFEFIGDAKSGFDVIERDSWSPLSYE